MKKLVLLLVLLGVCAEAAAAQTTAVLGTKVLNGSGTLLSSGQWCFASTCLTVTGGAFTGSVASGTQTITVKDGSGTTYLTVPSAVISGAAFDWDTFILTSGMTASGVGSPRLACQVGATYTQTDAGNLAWYSVSQNGVCVWTTSGGRSLCRSWSANVPMHKSLPLHAIKRQPRIKRSMGADRTERCCQYRLGVANRSRGTGWTSRSAHEFSRGV
jgi:hypothetical protein